MLNARILYCNGGNNIFSCGFIAHECFKHLTVILFTAHILGILPMAYKSLLSKLFDSRSFVYSWHSPSHHLIMLIVIVLLLIYKILVVNSQSTLSSNLCLNQVRNFFNTAQNFRDDLQSCTSDLTIISGDIYNYVDQFTQNYDDFRNAFNGLLNCNGFVCQDRISSEISRYVDIMNFDLETIANEIGQAQPGLDPATAYCLNSVVNNVNNSLIFNLNC